MRTRLAEHAPEYNAVRSNFAWPDHAIRTFLTGGLVASQGPETVLDPACGDASILAAAYAAKPFRESLLCDISGPQIAALSPSFPHQKHQMDIYEALTAFKHVDMVVMTETLEHLEAPDQALRLARATADILVASSPIGDPEHGGNHEHLWAWDEEGYQEMIEAAGWRTTIKTVLTYPGLPWNSQIWVAR